MTETPPEEWLLHITDLGKALGAQQLLADILRGDAASLASAASLVGARRALAGEASLETIGTRLS
jgi:hypothetical protein